MTQPPNPHHGPPHDPNQGPPQGPPHYPPQQYFGPPPGNPLALAKTASILMIVLGSLCLICGGAAGCVGTMWPRVVEEIQKDSAQMDQLQQAGLTIEELNRYQPYMLVSGFTTFGIGLLYLIFGILVRGGSSGIVKASIAISVAATLFILYGIVGNVVTLLRGNPAEAGGLFVQLIILAVPATITVLLFKTLGRADEIAAFRQAQQQQQMWRGY